MSGGLDFPLRLGVMNQAGVRMFHQHLVEVWEASDCDWDDLYEAQIEAWTERSLEFLSGDEDSQDA